MEQRRKIRFPLNLRLEIFEPGASQTTHRTIDISSSGVRFRSDRNIPVGQRIEYFVTLMERQPTVQIRCNGSVVRIRGNDEHFEIAATVDRHETLREATASARQ